MNMMSDNRPISDTAYDAVTNEKPTIGEFALKTLKMQEDTLAMICIIDRAIFGGEAKASTIEPNENLMARLAAIQENQRAIMTAVKAIADKL